jgi:ectonucleotide pyrophosphatase/phosphodiesterase family protein 5
VINKTSLTSPPLLLLISFDGFRWDYPDLYKLPHFNSLITRGVRVKYINNAFATVTFPSHFTMVTGLYEETHGIVANTMYDPQLNATTTMDTMNDTKWWYVITRATLLIRMKLLL